MRKIAKTSMNAKRAPMTVMRQPSVSMRSAPTDVNVLLASCLILTPKSVMVGYLKTTNKMKYIKCGKFKECQPFHNI